MKNSKVRDFILSHGKDFDTALETFLEHFKAHRHITFKFKDKTNKFELLDFQLSDILGALHGLGWKCTYNQHDISNDSKFCLSGFIHGTKILDNGKELEYAVAGFMYYKDGWTVADGVLFSHDRKHLDDVYGRMLEIAKEHLGHVKEMKPGKKFLWENYCRT